MNMKVCEVCGKEHNGTYGSGRFCSYSCKQKYASIKGAAKGALTVKEKFGIKCECEFCQMCFDSKLELKKHILECNKRVKFKNKKHGNWQCKVCEETFETRAKMYEHSKRHFNGKHPNSAMIAKLRGEEYKVSDETRLKIGAKSAQRVVSEETKKRISDARKKYLNEHPDKIPFKLNHSSKESYPERYFREWLQKENLFSEQEFQVGRYSLDFAWPEKMIYLEIDGGQHKLDWMQSHDKERTESLSQKGWTCIDRVFWPDYQKLNMEDKEKYLSLLKEKLRAIGATVSARDS